MELDTALLLVADKYRRNILLELQERESHEEIHVDKIDQFAGGDVHVSQLHHVHLPRLENASVIERKNHSPYIERGENFEEMKPVLEAVRSIIRENPGL